MSMKTYIIRLIFSILSVLSIDQCRSQDPTKFSADLSCGPSIPFGNFANKNYSTVPNSNGLAKLGFSIYANLKYKFSGHFGISLAAESSFNKQDPAAISNYTNNGAVYPIDTRIVTDDWRLFKILAGFYYQGFFK